MKQIIDEPGLYRMRNGEQVVVAKTSCSRYRWNSATFSYQDDGQYAVSKNKDYDIVSKISGYHNPHLLTDWQVGTHRGYRLLLNEEIFLDNESFVRKCQVWRFGWVSINNGFFLNNTYRTKQPIPQFPCTEPIMKKQPVYVDIGNDTELSHLIQKRCLANDITWLSGCTTLTNDARFIAIGYWREGVLSWSSDREVFCSFKELSVPDFLDYVSNWKPEKEYKVSLNSEYLAEIVDGKVKVGCQSFSFHAVKDLAKLIEEYEAGRE